MGNQLTRTLRDYQLRRQLEAAGVGPLRLELKTDRQEEESRDQRVRRECAAVYGEGQRR